MFAFWRQIKQLAWGSKGSDTKGGALLRSFSSLKYLLSGDNIEKIKRVDLSNALKHTSKLKVTDQEIATLDEDLDLSSRFKTSQRYTHDLNKHILTPEIKKALKKESRSGPKPQGFKKDDKQKANGSPALHSSLRYKSPDYKIQYNKAAKSSKFLPKESSAKPKESQQSKRKVEFLTTYASEAEQVEQIQDLDTARIAKLSHNLDRTLFSPGVHFLQDPRTRIYNFTPYLKKIIKIEDFNFDAIEAFVSVSKDEVLLKVARENNKKFYSSTSSMTSSLTQFYYLLNNYNPASEQRFNFPKFSGAIEKLASSVIVFPRGTNDETGELIYSVESDKSADTEILLSAMGHCLETLLTTEENEFDKYKLLYKTEEVNNPKPQNVYNYATYGSFLMRSQLDCYDERLPGNGTFDLKTRAVCAIRYDSGNPDLANNTYQIWKLNGDVESFEREFKDLIRTGALLKYGFQARIGQMDGIFIAYHNINSFFGFQYLPLSEIDNVFYNHERIGKLRYHNVQNLEKVNDDLPSYIADFQFKMSIEIWESLLKTIIGDIEDPSPFRVVMKSLKSPSTQKHRLHVFVVPLHTDEVAELQKFPSVFKTSFKEDITQEQRLKNLTAHRDKLNSFNELTSKHKLLSYVVDVEHLFGNDATIAAHTHPYPHSKDQKWRIKYTITKCKPDPKKYLDILSSMSGMIASTFEKRMKKSNAKFTSPKKNGEIDTSEVSNILQLYSAIGRARAKRWEEKDSNPVIYKPK
ncbi:uncharacterized protein PRCAT00002556001 [Priceomyces carsonii]|uniref:uncharacterized protein n=1 Tax=Priceomyces carsonii TaxID=28549 RepID=UPI002EDAB9B0|nr:unnamed protein product [Priceomyces carsonii]